MHSFNISTVGLTIPALSLFLHCMNNSFGTFFRITTFGESHGKAIGVVIDGCPAGLEIDETFIQSRLDKRKPGQSSITTSRKEDDKAQVISGVYNGKSTGAPITILIENKDQRSEDYDALKDAYRPSHADYTYEMKYGFRDHRGSGRASARETVARVAAGAVAELLLKHAGIAILSYVSQVGNIKCGKEYTEMDLDLIDSNIIRCPDPYIAKQMIELIESVRDKGDTIGGTVTCIAKGVPAGLGSPVYNKLHPALASAMLSINAAHGFDYGGGFDSIHKNGSELNDVFVNENGVIKSLSNNSGGIQGGISNGNDVYFRVLFKPVSTLQMEQKTVNSSGDAITINPNGRHDPCVLPRAVPIVSAMAALVLADHFLQNKAARLNGIN